MGVEKVLASRPVVRIVCLIRPAPCFLSFDTVLLCSLVASVISFSIDSLKKMKFHQPLQEKNFKNKREGLELLLWLELAKYQASEI